MVAKWLPITLLLLLAPVAFTAGKAHRKTARDMALEIRKQARDMSWYFPEKNDVTKYKLGILEEILEIYKKSIANSAKRLTPAIGEARILKDVRKDYKRAIHAIQEAITNNIKGYSTSTIEVALNEVTKVASSLAKKADDIEGRGVRIVRPIFKHIFHANDGLRRNFESFKFMIDLQSKLQESIEIRR